MSKSNMAYRNRRTAMEQTQARAFTFVEVIVALAIVSISLLALLRLHIISIGMADTAEITSQAVFLANEKIAETLGAGFPKEGTNSGTVEKNALCLDWKTEVTDIRLSQLEKAGIAGLRNISVVVNWKQGLGNKHLQMSTYVADRELK
ncbi:MAG TPA: prepilin-type N-terminal cleavage/methylation domain-containing protein [Sedimentisphaerales bacterium]|nr:prepilin-type N-terminal cleavage/methylation domain-containing protein [Sedimentisphaerales bacterium]